MKIRCILLLLAGLLFANLATAADFFVATNGNDTNPGTQAKPFATMERARDEARKFKDQGVTVWLRGGTYCFKQSFELSKEDGGAENRQVVYRAYQKEEVRLAGGHQISANDFKPVIDPQILNRMDESARSKILQADLKALGITNYGRIPDVYRGNTPLLELFFNNQPMQLARWPNDAWMTVARTVVPGANPRPTNPKGTPGTFMYHGDRPQRWTKADDVLLHGYWCQDWFDESLEVRTIDTVAQTIKFAAPAAYGLGNGLRRYYALNLLEEIDMPGEWYLDRKTGILYFWPPALLAGAQVWVSTLAKPLISMKNASYVTLRGVTVEFAQGDGVVIEGGQENLIAGCTLRNLGGTAVTIKDPPGTTGAGRHNGVTGCDISEVGREGIMLIGGDRNTLTPAKHFAVNNHIHHFGRLMRTYAGAISVEGVGNLVAHNLLHHAPHSAVFFKGNDHVIEFNEMHHLMLETHDAGAVYMGRNWTCTGNIIRYNFIHHRGAFGIGSSGVYLDDGNAGNTIFGNVFYKGTWATVLGGSRNTTVENNIFIDCEPAVNVDDRAYVHIGEKGTLNLTLAQIQYKQPPWSTRYPYLVNILEDDPGEPKYNVVTHNVRVGGTWTWLIRRKDETKPPLDQLIKIKDNWIDGDPGFVDAKNLNFNLRDDSPVYRKIPGFQKIPFNQIGLYQDELRATWPIAGADEARKEPMLADKIIYPAKVLWGKPGPIQAYRIDKPIVFDGKEGEGEWPKVGNRKPATIEQRPERTKVAETTPRSYARAAYDDEFLYLLLVNHVRDVKVLTKGKDWDKDDGVEICLKNPASKGPIHVIHGFVSGDVEGSTAAGASVEQKKRLESSGLKLATSVGDNCWTAELRIPLKAVGMVPAKDKKLQFNVAIRRVAENTTLFWTGTFAQNWKVEDAGELVFK